MPNKLAGDKADQAEARTAYGVPYALVRMMVVMVVMMPLPHDAMLACLLLFQRLCR